MLGNGDACRARAIEHHTRLGNVPAGDFQRVEQGSRHHNGGAVLVVMEYGNIAHFLEPALNLKATGGGNVLQVDAAKAASQQAHRADDLVHILGADAQGEGVHVGKSFE